MPASIRFAIQDRDHGSRRSEGDSCAGERPARGAFLLARLHGRAIGCGGVLFEPDGTGYLKRMWVADDVRGLGVGGRLLAALEQAAREHGCTATTLETNATLVEAIAMYRAAGYAEVAPFNDEFYADLWFRRELASAAR